MKALIQEVELLRERLTEQMAAAEAAAVAPYTRNDQDQDELDCDMESQWHDGFHGAMALAVAELNVILRTSSRRTTTVHRYGPDNSLTSYGPRGTREPYMAKRQAG